MSLLIVATRPPPLSTEAGRPSPEDHINCHDPEMFKEVSRAEHDHAGSPSEDAEISIGGDCQGEQIENDQDVGDGLLAVSKVMVEIVSVDLQRVTPGPDADMVLLPHIEADNVRFLGL